MRRFLAKNVLRKSLSLKQKKKERIVDLFFTYLRLRSASAAATATMMMTAAPIARYVAVGAALVGGTTLALGEGEAVCTGAEVVGAAVVPVIVVAAGAAEGAVETMKLVPASDA